MASATVLVHLHTWSVTLEMRGGMRVWTTQSSPHYCHPSPLILICYATTATPSDTYIRSRPPSLITLTPGATVAVHTDDCLYVPCCLKWSASCIAAHFTLCLPLVSSSTRVNGEIEKELNLQATKSPSIGLNTCRITIYSNIFSFHKLSFGE